MHSTWQDDLLRYCEYVRSERRFSPATVVTYKNAIVVFLRWKFGEGPRDFAKISHRDLQDFIIEEQRGRRRTTVHNHISALRSLFEFLFENGKISSNPSIDLVTPKLEKTLPKLFTLSQIKDLLAAPMTALANGRVQREIAIRDSMILELFYGAGLRISELRNIELGNIDFDGRTVKILGKRGKERICPFSIAAKNAIKCYLASVKCPSEKKLLANGEKLLTAREIQYRMKFYLGFAGLPMDLSPHKIRHSYATHLLNAGADLRLLQELLGHANLSTTQIYTHVDYAKIKNIHANFHPRG
jgi:integrase/recombinase XerC